MITHLLPNLVLETFNGYFISLKKYPLNLAFYKTTLANG